MNPEFRLPPASEAWANRAVHWLRRYGWRPTIAEIEDGAVYHEVRIPLQRGNTPGQQLHALQICCGPIVRLAVFVNAKNKVQPVEPEKTVERSPEMTPAVRFYYPEVFRRRSHAAAVAARFNIAPTFHEVEGGVTFSARTTRPNAFRKTVCRSTPGVEWREEVES